MKNKPFSRRALALWGVLGLIFCLEWWGGRLAEQSPSAVTSQADLAGYHSAAVQSLSTSSPVLATIPVYSYPAFPATAR